MRALSVNVALLVCAALPAPVGRAVAREWKLRELTTAVDPDGDCKCTLHKGAAEISVPGTPHDLGIEIGNMKAPRALCEMEGDFSVRVKTDCQLSPRTRTLGQRKAYLGASLVIMADDTTYVRLDRAAYFEEVDGTVHRYANFELRSSSVLYGETPADPNGMNGYGIPEEFVRYLRLDRVGDKVAAMVSKDGVKWIYLSRKVVKLPEKVKVGVAAVNTAAEPLTVRFTEFGTARATQGAVKPLTDEQKQKLLATRTHGGIGNAFNRFSRLFLISSRMGLPYGVSMATSSEKIAKTRLMPVFPQFYRPTMREYLDAVAMQTSSRWKYDSTGKFYESEIENGPAEDLAIFEFTEFKHAKRFEIDLPNGWKSAEAGNRASYGRAAPQSRMDIFELGSYSSDDGKTQDLMKKAVEEISLTWAKRFKPQADATDLEQATVGPYVALQFEADVSPRNGTRYHWRQWVFSADNKCFLAASSARPGEEQVDPDIQAMLKSFRLKKPEGGRARK